MMRSMNSAVSSLKNHQVRMDVIGNNIANVNTVGFKGARVTFKDTYSQLVRTPSGHSENRGGINPGQVGLGMNISSIDNSMVKGSMDTTNIGTDLYINGEGFFLVDSPEGRYYTRDGNFTIDEEGYLTTQDGLFVMGYKADENGNIIEKLDKIQVPIKDIKKPKETDNITFEGNVSTRAGTNIKTTPATIDDIYDKDKGYSVKPEYAENKAEKRESIVAKSVTTSAVDSLGSKHDIRLDFVKKLPADANPNTWDVYAFYLHPNGQYIPVNDTTVSTDPQAPGTGVALTLKFGNDGKIEPGTESRKKLSLDPSGITGAAPFDFNIDLSKITQFDSTSDVFAKTNDGYELGTLSGMSIGGDGQVIGKFSNGDMKSLGQIVTATFSNVNGLQKDGENLWSPTTNSGEPNINKPGSGGNGVLQAGALEMSNVDLAKEFTNMIITQRGFQANSRVITATDQMLEELVNLKR